MGLPTFVPCSGMDVWGSFRAGNVLARWTHLSIPQPIRLALRDRHS